MVETGMEDNKFKYIMLGRYAQSVTQDQFQISQKKVANLFIDQTVSIYHQKDIRIRQYRA